MVQWFQKLFWIIFTMTTVSCPQNNMFIFQSNQQIFKSLSIHTFNFWHGVNKQCMNNATDIFWFHKKLDSLLELVKKKRGSNDRTGITECKSKDLISEEQPWPTFFCKTTQNWKSLMRMSQINKMTVFVGNFSFVFVVFLFFLRGFLNWKFLEIQLCWQDNSKQKSAAWNNFLWKHIFLSDLRTRTKKPKQTEFQALDFLLQIYRKKDTKDWMCSSPDQNGRDKRKVMNRMEWKMIEKKWHKITHSQTPKKKETKTKVNENNAETQTIVLLQFQNCGGSKKINVSRKRQAKTGKGWFKKVTKYPIQVITEGEAKKSNKPKKANTTRFAKAKKERKKNRNKKDKENKAKKVAKKKKKKKANKWKKKLRSTSNRNRAVKLDAASIVLRWGTTREVLVL